MKSVMHAGILICVGVGLVSCGTSKEESPNSGSTPTPTGDKNKKDEPSSVLTARCGVDFEEDKGADALKKFVESVATTWHSFSCSAPSDGKFSTFSTDFSYGVNAKGQPLLTQYLRFDPCGWKPDRVVTPYVRVVPEGDSGKIFQTRISKPIKVDGVSHRIVEWSSGSMESYECHVTSFAKVRDEEINDEVLYQGRVLVLVGGGTTNPQRESTSAVEFISGVRNRLVKVQYRPPNFR